MLSVKNEWLVAIIILMTGCGPVRSSAHIDVEFDDSVQGLKKGDQVYLLGVAVGQIDDPSIVNGRPIVPVSLREDGVFGQDSQVLFYIAADAARPGQQSLVGIIHSLPLQQGKPRFRGFSSKSKVMLQIGAEKAQSWWNSLGISK